MTALAILGSQTSHGGSVTSCSGTVLCGGVKAARVGDLTTCPTHGAGTITSGATGVNIDGQPAAHVGSMTSCGATITTGASGVNA
jgi:uncharacterized Zn-binding protein involved in type VI secretion